MFFQENDENKSDQKDEIQKTEIHTEKDESKNELKNEVNVEPFSTPAEKKVVKIELFEYDIDDSQIEDEEIENQLLQRTMSLTDLSISKPIENSEQDEDTSKLIPLAKSTSLTNLSKPNLADLNPESEFLKSAVDALEEHRQEQAAIEKQIQNLMEASLKVSFFQNSNYVCTMLQKLSKCEVKAARCGNFTICLPLRFYVKSNFGEFKQSK